MDKKTLQNRLLTLENQMVQLTEQYNYAVESQRKFSQDIMVMQGRILEIKGMLQGSENEMDQSTTNE